MTPLAKLGKLICRAGLLECAGQYDAAADLTQRTIAELRDLNEEDTRLAFMGGMGFLGAAAQLAPNPQSVALLAVFEAAADDGSPEALRNAVTSLFDTLTPQPPTPLQLVA
jgi:hypothetical protein